MLIKVDVDPVYDAFQNPGLLHGKIIYRALNELNFVCHNVEILLGVLADCLLVVVVDIGIAFVHSLAFGYETILGDLHRLV